MLRQQVWEIALADRAAGRVYAVEGDEEPRPVDPDRAVTDWAQWLGHDPEDTKEARVERRLREITEAA